MRRTTRSTPCPQAHLAHLPRGSRAIDSFDRAAVDDRARPWAGVLGSARRAPLRRRSAARRDRSGDPQSSRAARLREGGLSLRSAGRHGSRSGGSDALRARSTSRVSSTSPRGLERADDARSGRNRPRAQRRGRATEPAVGMEKARQERQARVAAARDKPAHHVLQVALGEHEQSRAENCAIERAHAADDDHHQHVDLDREGQRSIRPDVAQPERAQSAGERRAEPRKCRWRACDGIRCDSRAPRRGTGSRGSPAGRGRTASSPP